MQQGAQNQTNPLLEQEEESRVVTCLAQLEALPLSLVPAPWRNRHHEIKNKRVTDESHLPDFYER